MDLAQAVHSICLSLPVTEQFNLTSQMRRAMVSVPLNIAEGSRRHHPAEFIQFIGIALGSLGELETCLELCVRFGYIGSVTELTNECEELGKMLNGLRKALEGKAKKGT